MFRDFATILKDMTASSVHVVTALGNEDPKRKGKYRPFKAIIGETNEVAKGLTAIDDRGFPQLRIEIPAWATKKVTPNLRWFADFGKRDLQPNADGETAKSPFRYDPNALGSLRPDQVPRFFGALTDGEKLPTKEVKLDDLHAMQDRVDPAKVKAISENGTGGKKAVVVQHAGKQYIADGHHRLTADWLAGKESAEVHFKDLEPVSHALKGAPEDLKLVFSSDEKVAKAFAGEDDLGIVYGWAVVCKINGEDYYDLNIDHAGQHAGKRVPENIRENGIAKSTLGFCDSGAFGNEMHAGPDRGDFPFRMPITTELYQKMYETDATPPKTGLFVGYRPPADVLEKFRSGEYTGFSIEGSRLDYTEHAA